MSKLNKTVTRNPLKEALPVLIALILIFGITIVIAATSGLKSNPMIDNPDGVFLELGNHKITNKEMYYALRNNYGYEEITRWADKVLLNQLLKDEDVDYNSQDFKDFKNKLIYETSDEDELNKLTQEEKDDLEEDFNESLYVSGYRTPTEREEYIKLEYRKRVYAKKAYEEKVAERKADDENGLAFDPKKYEEYYKKENITEVTAIYIVFDSQEQAKAVMRAYGIDTDELSNTTGWLHNPVGDETKGTAFTRREVIQAFIDMYNEMYSYYNDGAEDLLRQGVHYVLDTITIEGEEEEDEDEVIETITFNFDKLVGDAINEHSQFVFTKDELATKNSALQSTLVTTLKIGEDDPFYKSYTISPKALTGNGYILAIKLDEEIPVDYDFDWDEDTDEEKIPSKALLDEIEAALLEETFTDDVIKQMLFEMRLESGLKIYDIVLESIYKSQHDNFFKSTLKLKEDEYEAFPTTKQKEKKYVASINVADKTEYYDVDDLFTVMTNKYGVNASFSFMNNYLFLNDEEYNKVYNPYTKEIFDEDELKRILKEEVKTYEYYFKQNYFASQGFSGKYGWKNFLNEFFQVEDERELAVQINVLSDAQKEFVKTFYTYGTVDSTDRSTLWYQMNKIVEDYFSGSVINLIVFLDYDNNGSADTYELEDGVWGDDSNWTDTLIQKAKELAKKIYAEAPRTGKVSLSDQLTTIVNEFKDATYDHPTWGAYKALGLRLSYETANAYTNTSTIVDEFKDEMRDLYQEIEAAGALGKTLDTPLLSKEPFATTYGYHMIGMVSTVDRVYADKEAKRILPTEEEIEKYLDSLEPDATDEEKEEISAELKAAINAYYTPAVSVFESDNYVNLELIKLREKMVDDQVFKFTDADQLTVFAEITEILAKKADEAINEGA